MDGFDSSPVPETGCDPAGEFESQSRGSVPRFKAGPDIAALVADANPDGVRRKAECQALENEILTLWGHINAATYRFLTLLAEFDRKQGWSGVGILSCAHWLNIFCGIGTVAAREKVRVARALEGLPLTSEAFRSGEISYSKVRAMTRAATPEIEAGLLEIARHGTATHMERLVRHFRAVERREESHQAAEQAQRRYVQMYPDDDGMWVLKARLTPEVGAIVKRAIDAAVELEYQARQHASAEAAARDTGADESSGSEVGASAEAQADGAESDDDRRAKALAVSAVDAGSTAPGHQDDGEQSNERRGDGPIDASAETGPEPIRLPRPLGPLELDPVDPFGARRADGLKRVAERFLADEAKRCPASAERYQVVVHIDQTLLSGTHDPADPLQICELEHGPRLALETARRLSCDCTLVGIVESEDAEPLSVGRKTRSIPLALKRALRARDGGCRYPACERHRYTEGHHVEHWAEGGETKLGNLVSLCHYHHTLLHEGEFGVRIEPDGELTFTCPNGRAIAEDRGVLRRFRGSAARRASADTLESEGTHGIAGGNGGERSADCADSDSDVVDLVALNTALGLDIDARTARSRWLGDRMDYNQAIDWLYFTKYGRL